MQTLDSDCQWARKQTTVKDVAMDIFMMGDNIVDYPVGKRI